MQKEIQLIVVPEVAGEESLLKQYIAKTTEIEAKEITHIEILKRSIDARQRQVKINLRVRVYAGEEFQKEKITLPKFGAVHDKDTVLIIGAGPAGLFAALKCIELRIWKTSM